MGLVQHHHVVEALAAEGADEPFHVRIRIGYQLQPNTT